MRSGRAIRRLVFVTAAALVIALSTTAAVADPPVLNPLPDLTAEATSSAGAAVSFSATSPDPTAAISCDPASGTTFVFGVTTVTCTATVGTETATASFSITVHDTTAPVVSTAGDQSAEATSSAGAVVSYGAASASDAVDGSFAAPCTPGSGSPFPLGTTTVTCTATDSHGNTGSASFSVHVNDTTPPELHLPGNQTAQTSSPSGTAVSYTATATDAVDGPVTPSCSPPSGAGFPIGSTGVQCSATDHAGNTSTGSFTVTVNLTDTTPPVVTAPGDVTREATSGAGASVSYPAATAHDNVDGDIPASCNPSSGSVFPLGTTTVTCSATDAHGNTGTDTFHVLVRDTTAPVVNVPSDPTAEETSASGAAVTFAASADDLVDGHSGAQCTPASGGTFSYGTTTVTCHATDAHGNTGTGTFHVNVVDTTAPTLNLPADKTVQTPNASGTAVSFSVTATDASGTVTPSCSPASGAVFLIGVTVVHCTATDTHTNTTAGSFSVTVVLTDTTPPVVTAPADVTREATSGAGATVTYPAATAHDNVDGDLPASCAPASGSTFAIGTTTVTCSATDAHGNTGTATLKVVVHDTTAPVVTPPADVTQEASSSTGATVSYPAATAHDNIDGNLAAACSPASGSAFSFGATTVTCSATDAHGNKGTATFKVNVVDSTGPVVTVPDNLAREANGPTGAVATFVAAANDAVDGPITPVTCTPASGSTFPLGTTTVTCSASDTHGNVGHASFSVTVKDTTAPRLNVPAAITLTAQGGLAASDPTIATFLKSANANDLVDGVVAVTNNAPGQLPMGATTITFTATDSHGNKTVATSTITLTTVPTPPPSPPDTQPPAAVTNLTAKAANASVKVSWVLPTDRDFDHVVVDQSVGGSPAAVVYTGSATTFTSKGLRNGVEYRFVVVSYDKVGNASAEAAVVATPIAPALVTPKDGARTTTPPILRWHVVAGASYYNVQIYRVPATSTASATSAPAGVKVLSMWPTVTTLHLAAKWTYAKKKFQLTPGMYRWYVWAGFGVRADAKYGPLLGASTFLVSKKKK